MGDFKENINSWSPKTDEWQQNSEEYKEQLGKYATTISGLLKDENKKDEKLIGTFDIESTLLNGRMDLSKYPKYNTANPGAIALIRFLKEQKKDKYESSIASIASAKRFGAYKLLNQDKFFKNNPRFTIYNKVKQSESDDIEGIKEKILNKITDETQKEKMKSLLNQLELKDNDSTLNKKYSVVLEALYRKFILNEQNINMLFFDNDIDYIAHQDRGITNFLDSKLFKSNDSEETVRSLLTELGITITPICAASGHITFENNTGKDDNQPRTGAVFLNDLAKEVMAKQGLHQNEIDKKMLEAEKICFDEYISRDTKNKLDDKGEEINTHITNLDKQIAEKQIAEKQKLISAPTPPVLAPKVKNDTIVVKKCQTSGSGLLCFMHAVFGEKNDNGYECSDLNNKTEELKKTIIADVNKVFDGNNEADKKRLIEEYTSLVTAEIEATSDDDEKTLLKISLDELNNAEISNHDKKQAIINFINKINNTFPLIWLRYASQMVKNNIVLISEYNNDRNFHIKDHSVDGSTNDTYIHFDSTGVSHFSRCEKIDYKKVLDAYEINVSDIRLGQEIEEIYAKQRGIIDGMEGYNKEIIDGCINNIALGVKGHISGLKEKNVIVDDDFVKKIIQKKDLELQKLIAKKVQSVAPTIILNDEKKDNNFFKTDQKKSYNASSQNNTNNKERYMSATEEEYRSTEEPNTLYTPVYAVNNYAPTKIGEKIMSSSVNNSFKTNQPIDKNISKDYSNPYIAKLKELQEKAQKIGIFSRITLAIFSWFSSSSAKKRSAIKKLKTISIKNQDEPNYKDDKEMYDLLKKCLDDNKSFVSDIPTLPLENDIIYNNKKMQATQFDPRDIPATPLGAMHNSLEIFKEKIINFINSVPNKSEDNKELAKIIFDSSEELINIVSGLSVKFSDDELAEMDVVGKIIRNSVAKMMSNNKVHNNHAEVNALYGSLNSLNEDIRKFAIDEIDNTKSSQATPLGGMQGSLKNMLNEIDSFVDLILCESPKNKETAQTFYKLSYFLKRSIGNIENFKDINQLLETKQIIENDLPDLSKANKIVSDNKDFDKKTIEKMSLKIIDLIELLCKDIDILKMDTKTPKNNSHQSLYQQRASDELNNRQLGY